MHWLRLVVFAFIASCIEGRILLDQGVRRTLSLEADGDWAAYLEAESEDRSFLLAQLDATESEVMNLQRFLETHSVGGVLAGLQISAAPVKKNVTTEQHVATPAKALQAGSKDATTANKTANTSVPAVKQASMDPAKVMASLGLPSSKLKGTAALAPMLAMLKGMYADSKDRIAQQNTREEKSKKWFATKEAEHKTRMEQIESKFKNHRISDELHFNETRDQDRYFKYWQGVRQRQHRQFHTNLKIQHSMMTKVKTMIDMYEKTLSGKAGEQEQARKKLNQVTGVMPDIVLIQELERTVGRFCHESLADVRKGRDELKQFAHEVPA